MGQILITAFGVLLLVFIIISIILWRKVKSLTFQLARERRRKTIASQEVFDAVNAAMVKSINGGDVKNYNVYRDIFNDLVPSIPANDKTLAPIYKTKASSSK